MPSFRERLCNIITGRRPAPPLASKPKDLLPSDVREESHALRGDLSRLQSRSHELRRKVLIEENLENLFNQLRGSGTRQ